MQENNENPVKEPVLEDIPSKEEKKISGVKFWLVLLTAVFTVSMASGLYLALTPSAAPKEKEAEASVADDIAEASSLLKKLSKEEGAAVVKVRGVIQESGESGFMSRQNSASSIAKRIRDLADKKEAKALLLDINSPGGTVASVQDIYNAILFFKSKKKPVVALFRDVAASGGF